MKRIKLWAIGTLQRFGRGYMGKGAAVARRQKYGGAVAVISQAYVDHRHHLTLIHAMLTLIHAILTAFWTTTGTG